jgi:hypothetical protein
MRKRHSHWQAIFVIATFIYAIGCGGHSGERPHPDAGSGSGIDAATTCDPTADTDGDCIADGVEGCMEMPPLDTDGDGGPDYVDGDSDDDGITDSLEAGPTCGHPRDTDGDGMPDFQDPDSDNDGVPDHYEDRNSDGVIGSCSLECASTAQCPPDAECSLPMDGVGLGTCVDLECADGETDPHNPDTDGDGTRDNLEGTSICNPTTPENPFGLKPIKYVDSAQSAYPMSNWRLALDVAAVEGTPAITNPSMDDAAYMFDMIAPDTQVAGFLASRAASANSAITEINALIANLQNAPFISDVTVRVSGTSTTSLDGFDTVLGATLELTTSTQLDVTAVRKIVTASALGRPAADVTFPDPGWVGTPDTHFLVEVQSIRRAMDLETLFVGGVARKVSADDPTRKTEFVLNDDSNGSGVSVSGNGEAIECEEFLMARQAKADIIWLIDESGTTDHLRQQIVDDAAAFFQQAQSVGLDFRMGVTDLHAGRGGVFASRQVGGTGDRWLSPSDEAEFEADIFDPSGPDGADGGTENGLTQMHDALMLHTPRNNADPQMVREDASLIFIIVTDEKAQEVKDAGILGEGNNEPTPAEQTQIDNLIAPYITQLQAENAQVNLIGDLLPFGPACSAEKTYGYFGLVNATGGLMGSICQVDLSATIAAMIENIVGSASPLTLSKVPISASISVSKQTIPLDRSRQDGFDYRGGTNSISFYNQMFSPAHPADIVVSYRRWAQQGPIQ